MSEKYQRAEQLAQAYHGNNLAGQQLKNATNHIFAKMIVDGRTIGKRDGKVYVEHHIDPAKRLLPASRLP